MDKAFDSVFQREVDALELSKSIEPLYGTQFRYQCLCCGEEVFLAAAESSEKSPHLPSTGWPWSSPAASCLRSRAFPRRPPVRPCVSPPTSCLSSAKSWRKRPPRPRMVVNNDEGN